MILIPVKNLAHAKQRLAPLLDQTARTELAQTMLRDVLLAVSRAVDGKQIGLVTSDPYAVELAEQFRARIIRDEVNLSQTAAIEMATQVCVDEGELETLVIPADVPLIRTSEIREIFLNAPARGCVLVAARDGRGTNAVLRRPADLVRLKFGNDSFLPHQAAVVATTLPYRILRLPGVALDIDRPDDLRTLITS